MYSNVVKMRVHYYYYYCYVRMGSWSLFLHWSVIMLMCGWMVKSDLHLAWWQFLGLDSKWCAMYHERFAIYQVPMRRLIYTEENFEVRHSSIPGTHAQINIHRRKLDIRRNILHSWQKKSSPMHGALMVICGDFKKTRDCVCEEKRSSTDLRGGNFNRNEVK